MGNKTRKVTIIHSSKCVHRPQYKVTKKSLLKQMFAQSFGADFFSMNESRPAPWSAFLIQLRAAVQRGQRRHGLFVPVAKVDLSGTHRLISHMARVKRAVRRMQNVR